MFCCLVKYLTQNKVASVLNLFCPNEVQKKDIRQNLTNAGIQQIQTAIVITHSQMPKSTFDTKYTLKVITVEIKRQMNILEDQITSQFVVATLSNPQFNWDIPAKYLGTQKRSLKRWVSETYQRQINKKLSQEDHEILLKYVRQALHNGYNLCNKDLQLTIKAKLSYDYHWQSSYSAFTNAKRLCISETGQIVQLKKDPNRSTLIKQIASLLGIE
ncbi:Conserved_hypothetical protein [Hexamita inflata]|uniref:Uncharacterized protein n=1 Tax=Hexamita inflata TaxID=28002 RepID=A0ABP1GFI8_9EUKA